MPSELCKKLKFNHSVKWYIPKSESVLVNEMDKILWDCEIQTDHLISAGRRDLLILNKKRDFAVPGNYREKIKDCEKIDTYLDLDRELRKQWNIRIIVIPIAIGALRTIPKGLERKLKLEVEGRIETMQTTALLTSDKMLRSVLDIRGDLLSLRLQWKKNIS